MPWTTLYRLRRVAAGDRGVDLIHSCRMFPRSPYQAQNTEGRESNGGS
jgi:hypothetical protein